MFGHLKAQDFMTAQEGAPLAEKLRTHLESCSRCKDTFAAVVAAHSRMTAVAQDDMDHIPEPDWSEFRNSVRATMLSRAAKRDSVVRRWTGWPVRPAMAWGLSMVLAVSVTAGLFMVNAPQPAQDPAQVAIADDLSPLDSLDSMLDANIIETELTVWSQTGMFDELALLDEDEIESLKQLLEAEIQ